MKASQVLGVPGAAAFLLTASLGAPFAATSPSGTAVAVIQATDVIGSTGQRVLKPEAPIFMGDRVNTDTIGEAQIRFRDNTRLVVGPNSSLLIDKFVFSDETTARSVTVNAVRGTFRFITGSSPSSAYLIRTPTATIGLRGTYFDFSVGELGETRLALYGGGVRFCDLRQRCIELAGRCDVVVAMPGEGIRRVQSASEKAGVIEASFPYLRSQWRLNADFRVDTGSCAAAAVNHAGLMPAPTPPAPPHCPPGKDYGHGKHGKGDWAGRHGGKGQWSGERGAKSRGGKGDSGKGYASKSHGGPGYGGKAGNSQNGQGQGWSGGVAGFGGKGGKGGGRGR